jgi:hypothetical protein
MWKNYLKMSKNDLKSNNHRKIQKKMQNKNFVIRIYMQIKHICG